VHALNLKRLTFSDAAECGLTISTIMIQMCLLNKILKCCSPRLEENQRMAARVLPQALRHLDGCIDAELVRCLTLLVTNMLTNNGLFLF